MKGKMKDSFDQVNIQSKYIKLLNEKIECVALEEFNQMTFNLREAMKSHILQTRSLLFKKLFQ
jgi:hypothetical protein